MSNVMFPSALNNMPLKKLAQRLFHGNILLLLHFSMSTWLTLHPIVIK